MDNQDKIDLALRGGLVAKSILQMMTCNSKLEAKFIMQDAIEILTGLDNRIKELPEEGK